MIIVKLDVLEISFLRVRAQTFNESSHALLAFNAVLEDLKMLQVVIAVEVGRQSSSTVWFDATPRYAQFPKLGVRVGNQRVCNSGSCLWSQTTVSDA